MEIFTVLVLYILPMLVCWYISYNCIKNKDLPGGGSSEGGLMLIISFTPILNFIIGLTLSTIVLFEYLQHKYIK